MEITKKQETTTVTTQSIDVNGSCVRLEVVEIDGQILKCVRLERLERKDPLIANVVYLYSVEEARAAFELLKSIVEGKADG